MRSTTPGCSTRRTLVASVALSISLAASSNARAQDAPPPPPGFAPPPAAQPGYPAPQGYPPAGYAPPPGYAVPPGYAPYGYDNEKEMKKLIKRWEPGEPIPAGYHVEEKPKLALAITGGVLFGTFWLFSAAGGVSASHDNGDDKYLPLVAPVVGPFIAMGTVPRRGDSDTALIDFGLALDGLVQAGGAAMLVAGLMGKSPKLVRNDARAHVTPTPMRVGTGQDLGLVGAF